jgi:hypothetical protein
VRIPSWRAIAAVLLIVTLGLVVRNICSEEICYDPIPPQ